MPHVQITSDGFFVDGVRVEVLAEDFEVDLRDLPNATVRCTIPADTVEIDLPDAVLGVLRDQSREPSLREEVRLVRERMEDIVHAFDPLATGQAVGAAINQAAASANRNRGGAK